MKGAISRNLYIIIYGMKTVGNIRKQVQKYNEKC